MNNFTLTFLLFLSLTLIVEFWLSKRHFAYILAHRDTVPEAFRSVISLEAHQKAADYTLAKGKVGEFERLWSALILLGLTLGGGIDLIAGWWGGEQAASSVWQSAAILLSIMLLMQLLELPLSIYLTFVVEQRFGFNRSSVTQFVKDLGLQWVLILLIGMPVIALILWVMTALGAYWWLLAWAILQSISILMSWVFPTLIAPLFNKFTPLQDQTLRARIEALLERCGFQSKGIFVMDGSRRSGHGNAYFTGIGNNKRIVFFDTLVESLTHDELEAVLAHELGHFKRKHVLKMLIASAVMTLVGFAVLGWLVQADWFYAGLGVHIHSNASALLLFSLIAPVFAAFLQPLIAYFQRRHEFEADAFAASLAQPDFLVNALVKLYRDNANTLTPDPLYAAYHYSHPPAAIRIAHLQERIS